MKKFIIKIFGRCDSCGRWFKYPKRRRTNTAYNNEESNYSIECLDCYNYHEECWEQMWKDYTENRY